MNETNESLQGVNRKNNNEYWYIKWKVLSQLNKTKKENFLMLHNQAVWEEYEKLDFVSAGNSEVREINVKENDLREKNIIRREYIQSSKE